MPRKRWMALACAAVAVSAGVVGQRGLEARPEPSPPVVDDYEPTPGVDCGAGSSPESTQGRLPAADYAPAPDGAPTRAEQGYYCNAFVKAHHGESGGYRVNRYIDAQGHECAFYDTTLLWPIDVTSNDGSGPGVYVLDMSDPANPAHTATLATPAMQSPHESFSLNRTRGLLAAGMGYPTFQPGFVDVYDISQDCRSPEFRSSLPLGVLGHEGEFSPDGLTFWVTSLATNTIVAVDVADPALPSIIGTWRDWSIHGLNISDDGNRFYGADLGSPSSGGTDGSSGLTILDVSDVQLRLPDPELRLVSHLTWKTVSTPQTAIPVTITTGKPARPHRFIIEVDEFGGGDAVGAARVVNIDDESKPHVVSNLRLEVNNPEAQAGEQADDPGASSGLQGYDAHYCAVPRRDEPGIVACSFIVSGLRVFDIRDPYHPVEIAYANQAAPPGATSSEPSAPYAMSAPTFVPERGEIWYSDGASGFYNVQITNGVWPFPSKR